MSRPPLLATRLLERFVPDAVRRYLLADLGERYEAMAVRSPARARVWYWRQTFSALVRPLPGAAGVPARGSSSDFVRDVLDALRSLRRRPGHALADGVRRALGASGTGVGVEVLAWAGRRVAAGLVLGLLAASLVADGISGVLYDVDPYDWSTYVAGSVLLGAVGLAAAWLPARRAARIQPAVAIRAD